MHPGWQGRNSVRYCAWVELIGALCMQAPSGKARVIVKKTRLSSDLVIAKPFVPPTSDLRCGVGRLQDGRTRQYCVIRPIYEADPVT
jgi:hypothetical protein